MGAWSDFFVAELGAAAALAGLVMVAISINLARILDDPGLPGRAAETLVAPSGVLVASSLALVPGQPSLWFGSELVVIGLLMMVAPVAVIARLLRRKLSVGPGYIAGRVLLAAFSCVPFVVSGALLMASAPAALYWLVPGVIVSLVATVLNAWVLLVEILR
jgi:modulator of FtsH protease